MTLMGTKKFEETNKLTNQSGGDASITDTNSMTSSIKIEANFTRWSRKKNRI